MKPQIAFVTLAAALQLFGAAAAGSDRVIAETAGESILYRMIACEPSEADTGSCHAHEQERLDRRIHRVWIDAAAKAERITLTPEEQASVARQVAQAKPGIERAAKRFHALAVAVMRIRRGEDRSAVLGDLSRDGIPARDLDWEFEHVRTLPDAERAASKDFVADGERGARDYYTRAYTIAHLRDLVRRRAAAAHETFDAAETQFWSEIATVTHTRIVDPAFVMPDRKGILVSR